jgi:hypothetical protein
MGVDDGAHVHAPLIGAQVHRQLGGRAPRATAHGAVETEFHEILRAKVHFGESGRRHQYGVIANPDGDIAVLARDEPALIEPAADDANRLPELVDLVRGGYPIL